MIGRMAIHFVILGGLASTGCPKGEGIAPREACESVAVSLCERFYACLTPDELALLGMPTSEAACVTQFEAEEGCARQTRDNVCKGNERYHADQAERCVDQVLGLECSQLRDGVVFATDAPSCERICVVD